MLRCVCFAGLIAMVAACSTKLNDYQCVTAEDCVGASEGRCEPSGHCSFADESCDDGFRFGEASGVESNLCVEDEVVVAADAAPGAPDAQGSVWLRRQQLTFNNVAHAEDLIDFPVLLVLTPDKVEYGLIANDGTDLRFTNAAGDMQLAYEIEVWDPDGTSYIWLKAPQISASADTDHIYMYYNNPLASPGQRPREVWSNGYEAVYHLSEGGEIFANSVGPNNAATNVGTTAAAGTIGGGRLFDGTAAYLSINDGQPLEMLQGVSGMTATAWIQPQDLGSQQALVSVGNGGDTCSASSRFATLISGGPADELVMLGRSLDSDPFTLRTTPSANLSENSWFLVNSIVDVDLLHNDQGGTPYGHIDAVVNDSVQTISNNVRFAAPATDSTMPACATIGTQDDASNDFFQGLMDEVRISGVDRSPIWLQAQYQSMSDNDFVRFGAAEEADERFAN